MLTVTIRPTKDFWLAPGGQILRQWVGETHNGTPVLVLVAVVGIPEGYSDKDVEECMVELPGPGCVQRLPDFEDALGPDGEPIRQREGNRTDTLAGTVLRARKPPFFLPDFEWGGQPPDFESLPDDPPEKGG